MDTPVVILENPNAGGVPAPFIKIFDINDQEASAQNNYLINASASKFSSFTMDFASYNQAFDGYCIAFRPVPNVSTSTAAKFDNHTYATFCTLNSQIVDFTAQSANHVGLWHFQTPISVNSQAITFPSVVKPIRLFTSGSLSATTSVDVLVEEVYGIQLVK